MSYEEKAAWLLANASREESGCLISHLRPNAKGYIPCSFGRQEKWRAHRLVYMIFCGPIRDDLHVCHTCDTRNCIEPTHLFLGTGKENSEDMVSKGRSANQYTRKPKVHYV